MRKEEEMKKSIFKRWWFWVIIAVVVLAVIGSTSKDAGEPSGSQNQEGVVDNNTEANKNSSATEKQYQIVDLQTMMDELEENALRAESKYQNAYVEITGKIANFDSDGTYITIEPVNADEWNFDTVMCYIKNDEQRSFIIEKNVGDKVTIKGKIISIGEVLGYSMNIDSIS